MSAISNAVESVFQVDKKIECSQFESCMLIAGLYLLKDKQEESWKPMVQKLIDKIARLESVDSR